MMYDSPSSSYVSLVSNETKLAGDPSTLREFLLKRCVHLLHVDDDNLCEPEEFQNNDWIVENTQGYSNVSTKVNASRAVGRGLVVHSLLYENGIIGDPSHGKNEIIDSWVSNDVWTFRSRFHWPYDGVAHLELDKVDTIADVSIDGVLMAQTSSMHRKYSVKVPLSKGLHNISITLHPVGAYTDALREKLQYAVPHTMHLIHVGHYNLVRKVAADFGWDFAPAFAPCGLLGSIVLVQSSHAWQVDHVTVDQEHDHDQNTVVLWPHVFIKSQDTVHDTMSVMHYEEIRVTVQSPSGEIVGSSAARNTPCRKYCTDDGLDASEDGERFPFVECVWKCKGPSILVKNPELWWTWEQTTNDRNQQPLYKVTAFVACVPQSDCFSKKTATIGLRSFQLIRKPIEGSAESFYFSLNGQMIYSKGSNLVPLNIFHDKIEASHILDLVWSIKRAHFNTIRIWGGGGYVPDIFYEECDRLGILVWQEFMFACATYPTDVRFQLDVAAEVHQQSLRIINHPSVILFGFNNENENSFDWFPETARNNELYVVDYYALFINIVRRALRQVSTHVEYVDTSPSNGVYTEEPVYTKRWGDIMDVRYGDVHFYQYGSNLLSPNILPKAKFISEFGVLSLPSWNVYSTYIDEKDMLYPRDMMEFRTRRRNGLNELFQQMRHHFFSLSQGSAILENMTKDTVGHLIYLSQLQQGLIYRFATFEWRKAMEPSQTMGFLYWQLQQVGGWSGPSWSSLNSDGSWKLLHYFVRDFFAPVAVFIGYDTTKKSVSVFVSNHGSTMVDVDITVDSIPYWATQESDMTQQCNLTAAIQGNGYTTVCSFSMEDDVAREHYIHAHVAPISGGHATSMVFMPTEAVQATLVPSTITIGSIHQLPPSHARESCPPSYDQMFSMQISSTPAPALYVSFEATVQMPIHFLENAVLVLPWTTKTISGCYTSRDTPDLDLDMIRNTIRVFDLYSSMAAVHQALPPA